MEQQLSKPTRHDKQLGRKTHKKIEYEGAIHDDRAYNLALCGYKVDEIATALLISTTTLKRWVREIATFRTSLYAGMDAANGEVARAFYKTCIGYTQKKNVPFVDKDGCEHIIEVDEYIGPNAGACMNWLKNRDPQNWSDKKQLEHSGAMIVTMDLGSGDADDPIELVAGVDGVFDTDDEETE